MNERQPSRWLLNRLTAEMIGWLDAPDAGQVTAATGAWDESAWRAAELVSVMQGLGPHLYHSFARAPAWQQVPVSFQQALAREYESNRARVQCLTEELAAILSTANRAGLAVMPLKGLLIATRYYESPDLRPMADIDLLIRSQELPAWTSLLRDMGYRSAPGASRHTTTHNFVKPDGQPIPRPVELHTDLRRYLWVDHLGYDLTEYLWSGSQGGELLGGRVWVPAPQRLLTYLALHATYDLVRQMGRFVHWLDLAYVWPVVGGADPSHADWVYPALRLASRALPERFAAADLSGLADRTHPRLRRWADTVPLDGRCGLNIDPTPPGQRKRWRQSWVRWHPTPARLALAYGQLTLVQAYARHALTLWQRLGPGPARGSRPSLS